jgi:hypothetical protein
MVWTDYQKVFDRVPHSWIIKSLELIGINYEVISFTKKAMAYWRTCTYLRTENKLIQTQDIKKNVEYFKKTHYHHRYSAFASSLSMNK